MSIESLLTIIFSALVAFSTVIYAILTWKLVNETIKLRKAQTEPKISIRIEPNERCVYYCDMIIENIGLGPAYDITFKLVNDVRDFHDKPLAELNIIKNGIKYLSHGSKRQFFLSQFSKLKESEDFRDSFDIKVFYKNGQNDQKEEVFKIDFSEFFGISKLGESPMNSIASSLEKIEKKIQSLKP
jgi:hypothetical protein